MELGWVLLILLGSVVAWGAIGSLIMLRYVPAFWDSIRAERRSVYKSEKQIYEEVFWFTTYSIVMWPVMWPYVALVLAVNKRDPKEAARKLKESEAARKKLETELDDSLRKFDALLEGDR